MFSPSVSINHNFQDSSVTSVRFWDAMFFVLGLSLSTNLIFIFKLGNTPISLSQVIVFALFFLCLIEGIKFKTFLKSIPLSFKLYLLLIPISIINVFSFGYFGNISTFLGGIVELVSVLLVGILICNKKNSINYLLSGLVWGLLINVIVTLVSFLKWNFFGSSINFGAIFRLDSYAFYGDPSRFRAQGLFTESSYFLLYICVSIPIALLVKPSRKINTVLLMFLCLISVILSMSGNILIFFIELILCFISALNSFNKQEKKKNKRLIIGFILIIIVSCSILFIINKQILISLYEKTIEGFKGSNIYDESNSPRLINMKNALSLLKTNIFGFGYNMGAVVMISYNTGSTGAASTFLRVGLDLGILGMVIYCFMFFQCCLMNILKKNKKVINRAIGIALIGLFACQVSNGYPIATLLSITFIILSSINFDESNIIGEMK